MVELTEVDDNAQTRKSSNANAAYRGPGDDFPFLAYNILGGTHILMATAMIITGIIHIALSSEDRLYFLLTGGVSLWCPMAAMATGILGAVMSDKRHWEVGCIKHAFFAMNLITAILFMIPLAVVTGLIDFYFYQVAPLQFIGKYLGLEELRMQGKMDDRVALMWVIVALACVEFLICILSASICCCCSNLYREAETAEPQEQQIVIRQQSPPPIYVEKPAQQQPTIIVSRAAPQPRPQPIYVQAAAPRPQQPIYVQSAAPRPPPMPMIMPAPRPMMMPPQPIYGPAPSVMGMRRSFRAPSRRMRSGIF